MITGKGFDLDEYRSKLQTKHWSAGKNGPVRKLREKNINWIRNLPRDELEHGQKERQIQIVEPTDEESLIIQYPGKESVRQEDGRRPWDFRPRLLFSDGTYGPDLSFTDIWGALFDEFEDAQDHELEPVRALAAIFYRMAFMVDHTRDFDVVARSRIVDGEDEPFTEFRNHEFENLLRYEPPEDVIQDLSTAIPSLCGMNLESFLHYNDLLAWNEDCKYYYRDTDGGSKEWSGPRTGRINNLLTHISILGLITDDIETSTVLGAMQRGYASPNRDQAEEITDGILGAK